MTCGIRIGLDVGSASAKLAAIVDLEQSKRFAVAAPASAKFHVANIAASSNGGAAIVVSDCRPVVGNPLQSALDLLEEFRSYLSDSDICEIRVTGSGGRRVAENLGASYENELKAIARGVSFVYPRVRTIFEMGGESSKYLLLDHSNGNGSSPAHLEEHSPTGILDYSTSGECRNGTRTSREWHMLMASVSRRSVLAR